MLANRIKRVTVRNYRSLGDVTVELDDLTVFVGPNGSGKSNFLDALRFVRDAVADGLDKALSDRGGIIPLRHRSTAGAIDDLEIRLDMIIDGQSSFYEFTLGPEINVPYKHTMIKGEKCYWGELGYEIQDGEIVKQDVPQIVQSFLAESVELILPTVSRGFLNGLQPVYNFLIQTRFYAIRPQSLRDPQVVSPRSELHENGENFAATLDKILNHDNPWKSDLLECMARIVPDLDPQNAVTVRADADFGEYLVNMNYLNRNKFRQIQESDGTLRALGILTAIYQHPTPPVIGFEEPELYIHPAALAVLKDVFAEAALRSQVILTTHSPDLLNQLPASSLRLVERVDGVTQIGAIREHQIDVINQQLFGGGDLLRIGGLDRA